MLVADVEDMLKGYGTLQKLAGTPRRVIPGHDPLVMKRYPALNAATAGIVVRLDTERKD